MRRRTFLVDTLGVFAVPLAAGAQPPGKVPQIGVLLLGTEGIDISRSAKAFRDGLHELGWVEGRTVHLRLKFANRSYERLAALAAELVREKVDVIAAISTSAAQAAQRATKTIPIVMVGAGDPVGAGLVTNLAQPTGNITGVSLLIEELGSKRLALLRELLPRLSRIAVVHADTQAGRAALHEMQGVAPRLALELQPVVFQTPDSLPRQFVEIRDARAEALVIMPNPNVDEARSAIADLAMKHKLPTMFAFREYVEAGGLVSYGSNLAEGHRRAAAYADKILKGARPSDLPVEQAAKFELVINLKTAKALGLTIPQSLLLRTDQVIE